MFDFRIDVNAPTRRQSSRRAFAISDTVAPENVMPKQARRQTQVELLQGTLDMLVLRTLQWGPEHGHGIGQAIRRGSDDLLQIERGSLYPALHRLEEQGLIASEWKASETNRRAKYYKLTVAGKKQLAAEQSKWSLLVKTIARVMRTA